MCLGNCQGSEIGRELYKPQVFSHPLGQLSVIGSGTNREAEEPLFDHHGLLWSRFGPDLRNVAADEGLEPLPVVVGRPSSPDFPGSLFEHHVDGVDVIGEFTDELDDGHPDGLVPGVGHVLLPGVPVVGEGVRGVCPEVATLVLQLLDEALTYRPGSFERGARCFEVRETHEEVVVEVEGRTRVLPSSGGAEHEVDVHSHCSLVGGS